MSKLRTDGVPESDQPAAGGTDSVQALHRPHMDVMNDPVMLTVDGTIEADEGDGGGELVQRMHDTVMREHAEPRDGFEPVPMWVSLIFGGLLFWGGRAFRELSADEVAGIRAALEGRIVAELRR